MTRFYIICIAALYVPSCSSELDHTDITEQADMPNQGTQLQGMLLHGMQLQGMTMQGFQFGGATLNGVALENVRVEKGELVAEQNAVTLHGTALVNAHLYANMRNLAANPPAYAVVEYQITNVEPEVATYDLTQTGSTFLYTLTQNVDHSGSWLPACPVDTNGRHVAIPLAATWDEHGDRIESTSLFTFGCTTGVIAKCYRWGYRPWVTGYGDMPTMHWACTRLARADYCGDGVSHTQDGTVINVWDNLPAPGPLQQHGGGDLQLPPLGMTFEAGWNTHGAVCLSRARWLLSGDLLAAACPNRLIPPALGPLTCDTVQSVLTQDPDVHLFNESYLISP